MPYNLSMKAVERWADQLDRLLTDEEVVFTTTAPHKLAYRLREAIASAKYHGMAPYDKIDYVFSQTVDTVVARPRALVVDARVMEAVHENARNEFDVITIATRTPSHTMVFPNFSGETNSVKQWAHAKGYSVTLDPLTLTKRPL